MTKVRVAVFSVLVGCTAGPLGKIDQSIVAGAGFTTFDVDQGGCRGSQNGVNCNNYEDKGDVYMSGGPNPGNNSPAGLSDGDYFFAVLTPGSQNGGFLEGASGNLSDTVAGGTTGDAGSGDEQINRTFTVTDHKITAYLGTHATGTSPNGQSIIQLAPYDDTDNNGGVYILAICQVGATSTSQCKFDAFRIVGGNLTPPEFPVVTGAKYYDANANGERDPGEVGIADWPIDYHDHISETVFTSADGSFSVDLIEDSYHFVERQPTNTVTLLGSGITTAWHQTGNTIDQTSASGGATATLNADKSYDVVVFDDSRVDGLYFGNLCLGAGGGRTLGFWSNKNGQALIKTGQNDLSLLSSLNLRDGSGNNFDPATYTMFRNWLLKATATNMAYMLSAQLAAMQLNVAHGLVDPNALIFAPGTGSPTGFATIADIMNAANASLGAYPLTVAASAERTAQEALKNALDNGNNNLNFVQPTPATCPAPVF